MGADSAVERVFHSKLSEKLKQILPSASEDTLYQFVKAGFDPDIAMEQSIKQLSNESCGFHEIHLALVYCRNAQLMACKKAPDPQAALQQVMVDHDRHVSILMSVMEAYHESRGEMLKAQLNQEERAHLLSRAQHEWSNEKLINIFNYFKEMPVSKPVTLLHVGETAFTIEKSKELLTIFAASEHGNSALARLPFTDLCVELIIDETTAKTIHLRYGDFSPIYSEKRREMRVQSDKPIAIEVKDSSAQLWKGKVFDLSASGLGLSFNGEASLQPGDNISFTMAIRGRKMIGKGNVAWLMNRPGYCRMGVMVEFDAENHLRLENEVHRIEKLLKGELKMRGIPDAFL